MTNIFDNLKQLKQDMKNKGWVIDSFYFRYKKQNYIVLAKLFEKNENVPNYALLKLEFLKEDDFSDILVTYANSVKLLTDVKTLREYFDIEYSNNLGDIMSQFSQRLAEFIPTEVNDNKTENQKEAMCQSLSKSDSEDPRKKYCFSVRRNPVREDGTLGQRSSYNDNKTRLYRPNLYERLGADTNLSFRYSMNLNDEDTDENITAKWTRNKTK
ncbi:DUF6037 family protein [Bacillus pumilus]|uniref:DUF6037 family protein n=1 Tax=Bacillus pumilus TaxID=1408 RepID=UPI001B820E6A|nr:DUF6037 family protein [Bacillus pumilus]MBR0591531.1 hypothetical protein [Bacillus pumilus sxm20-2]MCY7433779.1 DUF6037 family protein [Bacillus pumilus]MED1528324.1 DUF6037 family protein [Bacillus pumilus]